MIRINLLPFRLARKKENIRRQVSVFFLSLVFILLALGWVFFTLNHEISRTRNEVTQIKAESLKYKKKADKVSQIKKNLAILEDKLTIVDNLKKRKDEQQILLEQLAQRLVETKMWLSSVSADAKTVSLKGIAFDNTTIAEFMRKLESFKMFGAVDLKRSQTKVFDDNLRLKEFEIFCTKTPPEQTDKDGKSKKGKK
ncbi:pilus assembly protein PilN [Desulfobacter hydrogenophilus]|uniref:Pilus assembly protein PilN n=1 Tax=Desulfobacter hydrogenophilus TaxID=2291 RepID=A0A328FE22_9BACT|nr:PilN domain-containing protein [Desulfobacter hydrogenophilus]NDY71691.1 pilus assembly protein PilN [Desulfobacter hydrogenophilus]QBH13203.1 pilus assembly protein PilN [Desulfobacter hydrogenophilus]RAM02376.1 pilus assembly protein PilN [Desulfobacter hydrogenophilus]